MPRRVEVLLPSTLFRGEILDRNWRFLQELGFDLHIAANAFEELSDFWPYSYHAMQARARRLIAACTDEKNDILMFARGGYGASDVLPLIPWDLLRRSRRKILVGFSDISAFLLAFHQKLGWPVLHAPMLASSLWGQNDRRDIDTLASILKGESGEVWFNLDPSGFSADLAIEGPMIGGCLSVLCNLLMTPFLQKAPPGAIVFLEEVGENGGRIVRYFNQVLQSGFLEQAQCVVFGRLLLAGQEISEEALLSELRQRCPIPVFYTQDFGHISPNMPIILGQRAQIVRAGAESSLAGLRFSYQDLLASAQSSAHANMEQGMQIAG